MSLPIFHHIHVRSSDLEDISVLLTVDMNLKHPVVLHLKEMDLDQQREVIGVVENFFTSENLSFKFPYPVYILSHHERSITRLPVVNESQELPKFFQQKETKMNVKEAHLIAKNKLLQQEIRNNDALSNTQNTENYGDSHRRIFELELERKFYGSIINKLLKAKKNG